MELLSGPNLAALLTLPGIGEKRAVTLAERFGDWDALLSAGTDALIDALGEKTGRNLSEHLPDRPLSVDLPPGTRVVSCFEDHYPARLRTLPDRPTLLWWVGTLPTEAPALAVVGTRTPNQFGTRVATLATQQAARHAINTISGLALGVDSICANTSLLEGVMHWAVLGHGIDMLPERGERTFLARRVLAGGGGLLSEVPPGTPVAAHLLTRRNRLQSGLSDATFIAQTGLATGAKPAGTLHTARFALAQGRYLAVPVPPNHQAGDPDVAGNVALTDPDGLDPAALHITEAALAAKVAARRPVADLCVRGPEDFTALWDHIAGVHAA